MGAWSDRNDGSLLEGERRGDQRPVGCAGPIGSRDCRHTTRTGFVRSASQTRKSKVSAHPVLRQLECTPQGASSPQDHGFVKTWVQMRCCANLRKPSQRPMSDQWLPDWLATVVIAEVTSLTYRGAG